MPGRPDEYAKMAREAADRVEAARAEGRQLTFLPDEGGSAADRADQGERRVRGKGKATTQMREWLAARGMAMPEDQLADLAGLAASDDALTIAMERAERALLWARSGAAAGVKLADRLDMFKFMLTAQLRAAEALLPYGMAKATPDTVVQQATTIVMPGAQAAAQGPRTARDVTPGRRRIAPPPLPGENVQDQGDGDTVRASDGRIVRT